MARYLRRRGRQRRSRGRPRRCDPRGDRRRQALSDRRQYRRRHESRRRRGCGNCPARAQPAGDGRTLRAGLMLRARPCIACPSGGETTGRARHRKRGYRDDQSLPRGEQELSRTRPRSLGGVGLRKPGRGAQRLSPMSARSAPQAAPRPRVSPSMTCAIRPSRRRSSSSTRRPACIATSCGVSAAHSLREFGTAGRRRRQERPRRSVHLRHQQAGRAEAGRFLRHARQRTAPVRRRQCAQARLPAQRCARLEQPGDLDPRRQESAQARDYQHLGPAVAEDRGPGESATIRCRQKSTITVHGPPIDPRQPHVLRLLGRRRRRSSTAPT